MSHGSARLTVHGRRLIVQRSLAGWRQAHIAAAMGVSRKCVRKWIDRFAAEGDAGLFDRSSRPHTSPTRTSPELEQKVLDARVRDRCTDVFHQGPYRTISDVEWATAGWVDWYNASRLHSNVGMVPPIKYEAAYYASLTEQSNPV